MKRENHSFRFQKEVFPRLTRISLVKGLSSTKTLEELINTEYSKLFPPITSAIHETGTPYNIINTKEGVSDEQK